MVKSIGKIAENRNKTMENPEEVLHSLEEFTKTKPKSIPRELEDYLCFVAKTGDPVYQWPAIKCLFREKLISVITEFNEMCSSVEIPPCPNVDMFNYEIMKSFILERLDTFAAAPFTLQRISELLTTPRKEYNRIDKYMRALEKNVLVVSTTEPGGGRRSAENGDGIMNGLEGDHPETTSNENKVEELEHSIKWPELETNIYSDVEVEKLDNQWSEALPTEEQETPVEETNQAEPCSSTQDTVITCQTSEETTEDYVSIEAVPHEETKEETAAIIPNIETSNLEEPESSVEEPECSKKEAEFEPETSSSSEETSNVDSSSNIEVPVPELTSSEVEEANVEEKVTSNEVEPVAPDESSSCSSEEDTVKIWYGNDEEISSSEKPIEEETPQPSGIDSVVETKEEEQVEDKVDDEEAKVGTSEETTSEEPMEVGEEGENFVESAVDSREKIVKAEATSDSDL